MKLLGILKKTALVTGSIAAALVADVWVSTGFIVENTEARLGRPMTPVSVAGVARRTTRRTIRRTTMYAATLPRGCTKIIIEGTTLHQCGTTYYQTSGSQYVVVKVN
ncbi:MAG: hypothetical protein GY703_00380 [Gammaproteobacteria bacterium]|nr:hypothetical protein [Gammaproteobacteria bacterium]